MSTTLKVLNRSSNPKFIGNDDMVLLTREETGRRFTRQEDPLDRDDQDIITSVTTADDDDFDDLTLPAWAWSDSPVKIMYSAPQLPFTC